MALAEPTPSTPVADDDHTPRCEACAACCFGEGERYVSVTGDDHARLGDQASRWTRFLGNKCFMRMHDGHCDALVRDPATGTMLCSIYALRPQVCRDLERGSPACDAERLRKDETAARWREERRGAAT